MSRLVPLLFLLAACAKVVDDDPADSDPSETDETTETDDTAPDTADTAVPDTDDDTAWDTDDGDTSADGWDAVTAGTLESIGGPPLVTPMTMAASGSAVLAADGMHAWISMDGGRSWARTAPSGGWGGYPQDVAITSEGWFVGASAKGVWFSDDEGRTWTDTSATLSPGWNVDLYTDGDALYGLSGEGDLYRWDAGTWIQTSSALFGPIAVDGDTVYRADWNGDLYVSEDKGESWTLRHAEALTTLSQSALNGGAVLGLGVTGDLVRSTDGGESFEALGAAPAASDFLVSEGVFFALMNFDGVRVSNDDGKSWKDASSGLDGFGRYVYALVESDGGVVAGSYQSAAYRTDDHGKSWTHETDGLYGGTATDVAFADGAALVAFGTPDVWSFDLAAGTWTTLPSSVDDQEAITAVGTTATTVQAYGSELYNSDDGGRSWDVSGRDLPTWIGWAGSVRIGIQDFDAQGRTVFAANPIMWEPVSEGSSSPTLGGISRSRDGGASWTWATWDMPSVGSDPWGTPLYPSAVCVRAWSDLVLAGTLYEGVLRSEDHGDSWTLSHKGLPADGWVYDIDRVGTTYFAAVNTTKYDGTGKSGVYRSEDGGVTWTEASDGLPANPAFGGLEVGDDTLFLLVTGTGQGIWRFDGTSWSVVAEPSAGVTLAAPFGLHDDAMVVGTQADGVLRFVRE